MAHLIASLKDYFELDEINIDSWTFKLYYRASCALCMLGATVGVASQYFGDPIRCQTLHSIRKSLRHFSHSCEFKGISPQLAEDYCWIHGSTYIPSEYQAHLKCIVDQEGLTSSDDAPDTTFYQWVTFFMALQAGVQCDKLISRLINRRPSSTFHTRFGPLWRAASWPSSVAKARAS